MPFRRPLPFRTRHRAQFLSEMALTMLVSTALFGGIGLLVTQTDLGAQLTAPIVRPFEDATAALGDIAAGRTPRVRAYNPGGGFHFELPEPATALFDAADGLNSALEDFFGAP